MTFGGLLTALITPFKDGRLDEGAMARLVQRQLDGGVDGLVPCGTTGEAPTLTDAEYLRTIEITVAENGGRVPVLAGIGSNNTAQAIKNAKAVEKLGVQGVLATAPYYNKPTQEGLYQHFKAIAEAISVEVCLYDVPGRSVIQIHPDTVARLAKIPNITTIKDATGDMGNASEVMGRCGKGFSLLSGDDFTTLPFIAQGGQGCISVASNIAPAAMKALVQATKDGDLPRARDLHLKLYPLFKELFCESNPIPSKAALAKMGLIHEELRLPLTPLSDSKRPGLHAILQGLELIHP